MPNNFMAIDQGLPRFTGEESLEQRVKMLQDYQYQLVEQLRYALQHLDTRNMNMDAMDQWGGTLTKPLYASLMDEDGNMLSLAVEAGVLAAAIESLATGQSTMLYMDEDGIVMSASSEKELSMLYMDDNGTIFRNETGKSTLIDGDNIVAGSVIAGSLLGQNVGLYVWGENDDGELEQLGVGGIALAYTKTGVGLRMGTNQGGIQINSAGNAFMSSWAEYDALTGKMDYGPFLMLGEADDGTGICQLGGGALVLSSDSYGDKLPASGVQGQVYILLE